VRIDDAYRRCAEITATEAKNFSYGIKLLSPRPRQAMCALYAMARRIDDVGDGNLPVADKLGALADIRKDVIRLEGGVGNSDDPVLVALADANRAFHLPLDALGELIEGCEMDVRGVRYETFDDLVGYCRKVAGTVGRLSLAVYGAGDVEQTGPLADDLGVALQITNILRDIVEDYRDMGRVYLPAVDRRRFGVPADLGPIIDATVSHERSATVSHERSAMVSQDGLIALVAFYSIRAEEWYERGLTLLPHLDRRSRACTAAMAGIYHRLLVNIRRDPAAVLRGRMSLPGWQKAAVAGRALARGTA
jgi:phytoene synthase